MDSVNVTLLDEGGGGGDAGGVVAAKVGAMCLLGLAALGVGLAPLKLASWFRWEGGGSRPTPVSILLCFGGGVLLFTTEVHLQPEVAAGVEALTHQGLVPSWARPAGLDPSKLLFCAGFFLVYFIEEAVHRVLDLGCRRRDDEVALHRSLSVRRCASPPPLIPRVALPPHRTAPLKTPNPLDPRMTPPEETASSSSSSPTSLAGPFRGLLTVLALSFHSIFEGLAVGLRDSAPEVWYLAGAIAAHKLVVAFCVGVELLCSGTRRSLVVLYVGAFALVTPVGVAIGLGLSSGPEQTPALAVASVVLQGLAAGTLLYVVFFEVLQKERNREHGGLAQFFSILSGFVLMLALNLLIGHGHSHGDHEHGSDGHAHDDHGDHIDHAHLDQQQLLHYHHHHR